MNRFGRAYRPIKGQKNKTEQSYSQHLDILQKAGLIESYTYEPETLKIGPDCRYTPDFRVCRVSKESDFLVIEFHEVKGTRRKKGSTKTSPYCEDDALVKIKVASEMHPYKFIIVWKNGNTWESKEIN